MCSDELLNELLPHLSDLVIEHVQRRTDVLLLGAQVRSRTALCRWCGHESGRVHGRYVRRLRDAAMGGVGVLVQLRVRRFRCVNGECRARTFVEQVGGLTAPHARVTALLRDMLTQIGLHLAGRAGSRLAAGLGIPAGRDTLLRLVHSVPVPAQSAVEALGVDDFAFRAQRHYGTLLIDMATHRPLDLFDGREGMDLASWLAGHPETTVICRDRSGGYGEGARLGAPQAIQVADRFHLWQNLGQAVEKTVMAHRRSLAEPAPEPAVATPVPAVVQAKPEKKIVTRMREHFAAVQHLRSQGLSKAAIGRELGLHQATVRKFANAGSVEELIAKTEQRAHLVDDYVEYLHSRWNEGQRNATQLFREIQQRGYPGGELAVQRYLRRFRYGRGHAPRTGPKPPSAREVTAWIMTHPDRLSAAATSTLARIRARDPELDRLTSHVRAFATMMTGRHGNQLEHWITAVEGDTLPPLASFARNLRRDQKAVHNGLSLPYSSGPVEGTINRLKMLKRQMFGRAGLELLRKRVLLTP